MTIIKRHRPYGFPALMEDFFNNEFFDAPVRDNTLPAVNIKENENGFELEMAAPGLKKEDFNLEVKDNTLVVSSKHEEKKEEKDNDGKYTRREFSYSSFSRTFNLPEDVDEENISAKYNDGVLNVQIPKKAIEAKKAKQILIG